MSEVLWLVIFGFGYALGRFSRPPRKIKIRIEGARAPDGSLDALAILDP